MINVASTHPMFYKFDPREDKVEHCLERFHLHCPIHEFKEEKKSVLLLTSVDGKIYGQIQDQVAAKPIGKLSL